MEMQTRTIYYKCSCAALIAVSVRKAALSGDGSTLEIEVQAEHAASDLPLLLPMSCRQSMQAARTTAEMQGLVSIDPKEIT